MIQILICAEVLIVISLIVIYIYAYTDNDCSKKYFYYKGVKLERPHKIFINDLYYKNEYIIGIPSSLINNKHFNIFIEHINKMKIEEDTLKTNFYFQSDDYRKMIDEFYFLLNIALEKCNEKDKKINDENAIVNTIISDLKNIKKSQ